MQLGGRKGIWPVKTWGGYGVGLPLVRLGWRPPGLAVPLPHFLPLLHKTQKIFHDGVQQ